MPKQEQTIALNNTDKETALAIGYEAMKKLNWTIQFAGENKISGHTPKSWKTYGQQIMIDVESGQLIISSEMVHGEIFDPRGKNKKNVAAFINEFTDAQAAVDAAVIENNLASINALREVTMQVVKDEIQKAEEVDKAMNLSGSNLNVTYAIMGINVLVFVLMAFKGAGIFEPDGYVHVAWGSNYSPLTLSGDWWRLISNTFIHFGIIHLAMNMYCLYMVGVFLEPMLGKGKYITAYLCTGILASLTSLWWHTETVNSAGASGAIFGLYGLFLALLTTNLIPKHVRDVQLKSIGIFVAYNLIYGMKSGVDNSAHIGGLISGFVIGYIYAFGIKKEKQEQKMSWIIPAVVIATLTSAFMYLEQNKVSDSERNKVVNEIKGGSYKDSEKFNDVINKLSEIEEKALSPLNKDSSAVNERVKELNGAQQLWNDAEVLMKSTESYDISEVMHQKAAKFIEYIQLRKRENELLIALNLQPQANEEAKLTKDFEETETKLRKVVTELKAL